MCCSFWTDPKPQPTGLAHVPFPSPRTEPRAPSPTRRPRPPPACCCRLSTPRPLVARPPLLLIHLAPTPTPYWTPSTVSPAMPPLMNAAPRLPPVFLPYPFRASRVPSLFPTTFCPGPVAAATTAHRKLEPPSPFVPQWELTSPTLSSLMSQEPPERRRHARDLIAAVRRRFPPPHHGHI
jgi:hypothetical protein